MHSANIFKAAFQNTFTAAKGSDGHREFSFARLIGPVSGSLIAASWRPGGVGRRETIGGIGLTDGLTFLRNLTRETLRH